MSADGHWVHVNNRVCEILGYSREELAELTFREVTHPDDLASDLAHAERLMAGEIRAYTMEKRYIRKDRGIAWVALTCSAIGDLRDGAGYVVAVIEDITERIQTQAALRESEVHLQDLNSALESRVERRTQALQQSEQRYREIAELAERRAKQLRTLTRELARTEKRERMRLASILHDHIQQLLVGAQMRLQLLGAEVEDNELQERIAGVAAILDMATEAARSLAVELVPPVLHSQGLPAAIHWLSDRMRKQCRLDTRLEIDPTLDPNAEQIRDLLFQTARELLLNIVKHAQTLQAEIKLTRAGDVIRLTVIDFGVGFDRDKSLKRNPSFGLFHLQERLAAIGGRLDVNSEPGKGTTIDVSVPLDWDAFISDTGE